MLPAELMRQIRRLQLRARNAVQSLLGGEYRSIFKGSGLSFEEVREYQVGDEVRAIDWNVTARMGWPFIKRYIEERELTVILLVDVSGSQKFGTRRYTKRAVAAELAALIAFSAIANNDQVGLIACSDVVERYVPPSKGSRHVLRLLRDILFFEPEHNGTALRVGLDHLNKVLPKRCIAFVISDFADDGYEASFRLAARRHDLVALRIADPCEMDLPDCGLVQVRDAETGRDRLIDTRNTDMRAAYAERTKNRQAKTLALARSARVDLIDVDTEGGHFDALLRFFRIRERRGKHR